LKASIIPVRQEHEPPAVVYDRFYRRVLGEHKLDGCHVSPCATVVIPDGAAQTAHAAATRIAELVGARHTYKRILAPAAREITTVGWNRDHAHVRILACDQANVWAVDCANSYTMRKRAAGSVPSGPSVALA
jgi:hypothetical protein